MSALKRLAHTFRKMGLVPMGTRTIEQELFEIGQEIERRHRATRSIHDGSGFAERINEAYDWASTSRMSVKTLSSHIWGGIQAVVKGE